MLPPSISSGFQSARSEEHTSELQLQFHLVCRLLLEKKKTVQSVSFYFLEKKKAFLDRQLFLSISCLNASPHSSPISKRRTTTRTTIPSFIFNDTATTEIYTLSLHDALPICIAGERERRRGRDLASERGEERPTDRDEDRKSTRLNSSHSSISYAVFCLK